MLGAWGAGLSADARDEVRAAGKAIVLLIDEIERLHVDLWNAKAGEPNAAAAGSSPDDRPEDVGATPRLRLSAFVPRLRRSFHAYGVSNWGYPQDRGLKLVIHRKTRLWVNVTGVRRTSPRERLAGYAIFGGPGVLYGP